ncbi:hypothetical protein FACS1894199_07300 [Bacteroidia bacterium]|nr:hypothetical protein FACS1894199_07300 [Bacteroidia bacterium]
MEQLKQLKQLKQNFRKNIVRFTTICGLAFFMPMMQSCELEDVLTVLDAITSQTGWLAKDEKLDNIPEDIVPFPDGDGSGPLPTVVSLESKLPPVGDQAEYGTCVAWATGYGLKTTLNAIEKGWSASDLAKTSNQISPKDLWMCIPSSKKGSKCGGTNFEPAFDAMISNSVASLGTVPYTSLGSCSGSPKGESAQSKLANYRKIAAKETNTGMTVDNFKKYLASGRPVAIGAKLGDRFMSWNSAAVLSSDTYNNPGMDHANHAMVLIGYDDSKNAFRVRNSWGEVWGDRGNIWVDYTFFCKNFCFAAFVAQNVVSISTNKDSEGNDKISSGDLSSGADLLAYAAEDHASEDPEFDRKFSYKVFNSGSTTIRASQKWHAVYMYYNATDAKDYDIIYEDYYTDEYGSKGDYDEWEDSEASYGGYWNNVDVPKGEMAGDGFSIHYPKLDITGKYYLVLMADSYDVIKEVNEDNNFFFIAADNGKPLEFKNGVITNTPKKPSTKSATFSPSAAQKIPTNTEHQTVVQPGNLNAYTPSELKAMLLHDKKTGKLEAKIKTFHTRTQSNKAAGKAVAVKRKG